MSKLTITAIQFDILWENPDKNKQKIERLLQGLNRKTDIIILPEMFTTGFTMQPGDCYEEGNSATVAWMKGIAEKFNCAVTGSLIFKAQEKYYNRLFFIDNDGVIHRYDKRHLFTFAGEHRRFTGGTKRLIVKYKNWRICPMICYDLRFPVWMRNKNDYDLLLVVANWPESRNFVWKALLKARAIENQAYVAGVNRVGTDFNTTTYSGDTQIIDPYGKIIAKMQSHEEGLLTTELDMEQLVSFRGKFPVLDDADSFTIDI